MGIAISESLVLKTITMEDYSMLYELMERIYPPAYNYLWPDNGEWYLHNIYSQEQVAKDLADKHSRFYFIEVDGQIEGVLKILENVPYPEFPHKKATRLHRIYISEEIQGKGISQQLMVYVEKRAMKNGSEIIWLDCMESKLQAMRFYEKHGFLKGRLTFLDYTLLKEGYNGMYLMWKPIAEK